MCKNFVLQPDVIVEVDAAYEMQAVFVVPSVVATDLRVGLLRQPPFVHDACAYDVPPFKALLGGSLYVSHEVGRLGGAEEAALLQRVKTLGYCQLRCCSRDDLAQDSQGWRLHDDRRNGDVKGSDGAVRFISQLERAELRGSRIKLAKPAEEIFRVLPRQ